jgi:hypothetical protein
LIAESFPDTVVVLKNTILGFTPGECTAALLLLRLLPAGQQA